MGLFFDTVRDLRRGNFIDECDAQLHQVVAAVEDTHKSCKLLIEITIKPASKGAGTVIISDKVIVTLPKLEAGETIMFVTPENRLVLSNPRQADLPLKSVPAPVATDLKNVNG